MDLTTFAASVVGERQCLAQETDSAGVVYGLLSKPKWTGTRSIVLLGVCHMGVRDAQMPACDHRARREWARTCAVVLARGLDG